MEIQVIRDSLETQESRLDFVLYVLSFYIIYLFEPVEVRTIELLLNSSIMI